MTEQQHRQQAASWKHAASTSTALDLTVNPDTPSSMATFASCRPMPMSNNNNIYDSPDGYLPPSFRPPHDDMLATMAEHAGAHTGHESQPGQQYHAKGAVSQPHRESSYATQFTWYPSRQDFHPQVAERPPGAFVPLPPAGTGVLPSTDDTQTHQQTAAQKKLLPKGLSAAEHHPSLPTPRSSVSTSSPSPTSHSTEKPLETRSPKLHEDVHARINDAETLCYHWPEICLEHQASARSDQGVTRADNHHIRELRWGSDTSFDAKKFIPPPHQQSHTVATDKWMGWISSIAARQLVSGDDASAEEHRPSESDVAGTDLDDRQRPKLVAENDTRGGIARRRHGVLPLDGDLRSAEKLRQRAERRKQVHNTSERKRREQLNKGFLDLCEIVPGLDISAHTRKEILFRTAEWLEKFLEGNACLKEQLERLKSAAV